jgi:hypothetical protein
LLRLPLFMLNPLDAKKVVAPTERRFGAER